jgi:hypothetical protein
MADPAPPRLSDLSVNLNSMVTVTLTAYGVRVLQQGVLRGDIHLDETVVVPTEGETPWKDDQKIVPTWTAPLTLRLEFWRLARVFGPAMRMSVPLSFENNELRITPIRGLESASAESGG